jgi:hypothetical protein
MSPLELLFTKAALIAGAGFFLWKVVAGWLVVNVEISIETIRQPETAEEDLLAFKITFKKGNTDTLQIKDIQARVSYQHNGEEKEIIEKFPEINKFSVNDEDVINWEKPDATKKISLSPNESFHFGRFVKVPSGVPVIVESVLHGTRTLWWSGFQWRASVASLPCKK